MFFGMALAKECGHMDYLPESVQKEELKVVVGPADLVDCLERYRLAVFVSFRSACMMYLVQQVHFSPQGGINIVVCDEVTGFDIGFDAWLLHDYLGVNSVRGGLLIVVDAVHVGWDNMQYLMVDSWLAIQSSLEMAPSMNLYTRPAWR